MIDRRVVPFKAHHYNWLAGASRKAEGGPLVISDSILSQLERENSWTVVVEGEPVVCAGTLQHWPGRHMAWAYVARGTKSHMAWITEEVLKNHAKIKGRIEFTVRKDFKPGQRWARQLGFEVETPLLRAYGPEGEDHIGYVKVN